MAKVTNVDDMVIYYHSCGWQDEAQPIYGMVNECPKCGARNALKFVTYDSTKTWEKRAAESLITRNMRVQET